MSEFWRTVLWPFSLVYGLAARARTWLYRHGKLRSRRLDGIVVSVGNLTAGGTGKTPMVIWLAGQLVAAGEAVAVLTRGYRSMEMADGKAKGKSPRQVSDEVLVIESHLGDRVPIGVGKDRYQSGLELERKGVKWFVLDDGFQHFSLARDADLVLIDDTDPFGGGLLLPAGRLREPISGLRRADAIVITRAASDPELERELRHYSSAPIFYAQTELLRITRIFPGAPRPATDAERSAKFLAFCGTGNPGAFFADLKRWGLTVAGSIRFPDHYRYTQRRINEMEDFAADRNAKAMLCTEKDLLNFGGLKFSRFPVFTCRIAMRPADPAGLWRALVETIERRGKSR
ncbi:MAG TPA: tetraacyldisaccharide 4'-kinase [Candidatus Dormibacteraeota bacterium]|nr:tetraacyldisaccharide 4'-kinase [Candidatus Dormibacteraeota bacterium]